jgi:hypothetical protein
MSRLTEIQNQYKGYVAAKEAVKKTNPGTIKVVYKTPGGRTGEGFFIYDPEDDNIEITPDGMSGRHLDIDANDVLLLIKALREFFE